MAGPERARSFRFRDPRRILSGSRPRSGSRLWVLAESVFKVTVIRSHFNRPASKRRAPCQIPCGELIGLSSAAVQRSCRRRSLVSFHAHRGPPCCATFAPIAARLSSWLKAAVASGRRRVGNARTQRKGEVIGRALSTLAATPGLLNMLSSQSACTPGAAGLGLHPPTDTAHTAPYTPPLAHRTARTRKPRAKGARSLVRRVPQKKFLP